MTDPLADILENDDFTHIESEFQSPGILVDGNVEQQAADILQQKDIVILDTMLNVEPPEKNTLEKTDQLALFRIFMKPQGTSYPEEITQNMYQEPPECHQDDSHCAVSCSEGNKIKL